MANFTGAARSNYFRVKDPKAFDAALERIGGIDVWGHPGDPALIGLGFEDGFLPSSYEDGEEVDFVALLAAHLAEGEVAVLVMAGHEKMRYVAAYAVAINNTGAYVDLSLDSIYDLARSKFGSDPTRAEY